MQKSASFPSALGSRKWIADILSKGRDDQNTSSQPPKGDGTSHEIKFSDILKKTKAKLLGGLTPNMKKKSWSKLTVDAPVFTHKNRTIERNKEKKSTWSALFDTKTGKKLHKRAKSEPTHHVAHFLEAIDEMPEMPLVQFGMMTELADGGKNNKTVDEIFEQSDALKRYARSIEHENDDDNESVSDAGTVIITRPEKLYDVIEEDEEEEEEEVDDDEAREEHENAATEDAERLQVKETVTNTPIEEAKEPSPPQLGGEKTDTQDGTGPASNEENTTSLVTKETKMATSPIETTSTTLVETAVKKGIWGLNQSGLIRASVKRPGSKYILPNCSMSQGDRHWQITDSVLKAYTAMRGPYRISGRDLFVWIDRCRKTFAKPEGYGNGVGSCDTIIARLEPLSLDPPPVTDKASDKEFFLVPRPPYEHIKAHEGIDRSEYEESFIQSQLAYASGPSGQPKMDDDQESMDEEDNLVSYKKTRPDVKEKHLESQKDEFYISDNEGTPSDGRISPCMFRLWAEGCERNGSANIDPEGITEQYRLHLEALKRNKERLRQRPAEQDVPDLDSETASHTSSLSYDLGPDPDYVPPRRIIQWQRELLDRMNSTIGAQDEFQQTGEVCFADEGGSTVTDCSMPFTEDEIKAALEAEDARPVAGVNARDAQALIRRHYSILHRCADAEEKTHMGIASARERIDARAAQLERVTASVTAILQKRILNSERRRRAIYRQISQHLRETQERVKIRHEETFQTALQLADLLKREKALVDLLTEEAERIGLRGMFPNDIERAVERMMNGEPLEDVQAPEDPEDLDDIFF
ncbi:hypothetical protein FZEAL_1399 [Fusarium zealandicum]|uniref:Uncharacterized protein n=1 Tax=Fusarium zealandicum TaxID=1053134 RepID=A0A8H4UTP0_9HYPO|nr:hypothetical protein FZEAL_1399 [Fusarium zealandicum]